MLQVCKCLSNVYPVILSPRWHICLRIKVNKFNWVSVIDIVISAKSLSQFHQTFVTCNLFHKARPFYMYKVIFLNSINDLAFWYCCQWKKNLGEINTWGISVRASDFFVFSRIFIFSIFPVFTFTVITFVVVSTSWSWFYKL